MRKQHSHLVEFAGLQRILLPVPPQPVHSLLACLQHAAPHLACLTCYRALRICQHLQQAEQTQRAVGASGFRVQHPARGCLGGLPWRPGGPGCHGGLAWRQERASTPSLREWTTPPAAKLPPSRAGHLLHCLQDGVQGRLRLSGQLAGRLRQRCERDCQLI